MLRWLLNAIDTPCSVLWEVLLLLLACLLLLSRLVEGILSPRLLLSALRRVLVFFLLEFASELLIWVGCLAENGKSLLLGLL